MIHTMENFRDLGGIAVVGGGETRHGLLYRGDAPQEGDVDPVQAPYWPPATVIDLRTAREAEQGPYTLSGADRELYPLHESTVPDNLRDCELGDLYRYILEGVPERVAGAVGIVVSRPAPTLVHCAAGRDRTGIVIAVLLLAVGVAPEDVVADYVRSGDNMDAVTQRITRRTGPDARPINPARLHTPAEAMAELLAALATSTHGDVRGWLAAHGTPRDALEEWARTFVTPSRHG